MRRAEALNGEALTHFRELQDVEGMGHALTNLALGSWMSADYDKASGFLRENLRMARSADYKLAIQYSLLGLGRLAMVRKHFGHAARLWGAAEAMEETFGIRITRLGCSAIGYDGYLAAALAPRRGGVRGGVG
jgi:hypothetical protein